MSRISDLKRRNLDGLVQEFADRIWLLLSDSHQKGQRWESEVATLATERGLAVEPSDGRGDMKVNGLVVQCKHIDAVRSGGAIDIANMRPVEANNGHRGYMVGEYDVLALRHHDGVYLIPAAWLDTGDGTLASHVRLCGIDQFRDGWSVFANGYQPPIRDKQMSFSLHEEATDGRDLHDD